jgi:hypothetical protein
MEVLHSEAHLSTRLDKLLYSYDGFRAARDSSLTKKETGLMWSFHSGWAEMSSGTIQVYRDTFLRWQLN